MTEFAGVDPDHLRTLANRLKSLANALAKGAPTIRHNFSEWEGTLNLAVLQQAVHSVADDAHDMALRADRATDLLGKPGSMICAPSGDLVSMPWNVKDIDTAQEARDEAADLKKAEAHPGSAASKKTIAEIGQSLSDHMDDTAYMTAFMQAGGIADATKVGNSLLDKNGAKKGLPLSKASQATLAQFGRATQVMTGLAKKSGNPHPASYYLTPLTNPPDSAVWSTSMLFKYGPSGDKWDPTVLSDVGTRMLKWRKEQEGTRGGLRPGYSPKTASNETWYGYGPSPYSGPQPHAWYQDLGLDPTMSDSDHGTALTDAVKANDPSLAVMNSIAQNAQASRDLLTKPGGTGLSNARELVDYKWQTPGPHGGTDESAPVGKILTFAATDRSPAHIDQSGQAADNILTAAAKEKDIFFGENATDKKNGYQQDYPNYPKSISMSLAGITGTWAQDLGSTIKTADSASHTHGYDTQRHALGSNSADLENVMQLFVQNNPDAAAMFDTTLHEQVSEAAAGKNPSHDLLTIGNTAGLFTKAKVAVNYTKAEQTDEQHKQNLALLNEAGMLFGFVPAPGADVVPKLMAKGLKYSQNLALIGRTIVAPTQDPFSTNNAAGQEVLNESEARDQYKGFSPAVVQGLIRSGRMAPPTGNPSWYDPTTKTVTTNANNDNDFNIWLGGQADADNYTQQFQNGFDNQEGSVDGK